jgi:hypothetical protein
VPRKRHFTEPSARNDDLAAAEAGGTARSRGWRATLDAARRIWGVSYRPATAARPFMERAEQSSRDGVEVTMAALSDHESASFFGVRLAHRGIQPLWLEVANQTGAPVRADLQVVDPAYYTPLEAAYASHFKVGARLAAAGLLAWLYLPLLPLVPFKVASARRANRRMNDVFKAEGFTTGLVPAAAARSGFVFTTASEGDKHVGIGIVTSAGSRRFDFSLAVPGLRLDPEDEARQATAKLEDLDEAALTAWIESQPRCTGNAAGTREGDPLNLVLIGSRTTIRSAFGARWDDAETIDLATSAKLAKAFLLDSEYRYSPVSPLYVAGRRQEMALQRARATINERLHLRLWSTPHAFAGQPIWIGQISRDIGVRYTLRTWNLTTHKIDPDVDEARDYAMDDLMSAKRVALAGYANGAGAAKPEQPRPNLTGDPYFTDGRRAVLMLSPSRCEPRFLAPPSPSSPPSLPSPPSEAAAAGHGPS